MPLYSTHPSWKAICSCHRACRYNVVIGQLLSLLDFRPWVILHRLSQVRLLWRIASLACLFSVSWRQTMPLSAGESKSTACSTLTSHALAQQIPWMMRHPIISLSATLSLVMRWVHHKCWGIAWPLQNVLSCAWSSRCSMLCRFVMWLFGPLHWSCMAPWCWLQQPLSGIGLLKLCKTCTSLSLNNLLKQGNTFPGLHTLQL